MNGAAETRRCENCGQPVLKSDLACWHCGAKLALSEPVPIDRPGEEPVDGASLSSLQQIVFYALLTGVTAVALLLVTRSLGRQPQLIQDLGTAGAPLVMVSAPDGSFSIKLVSDAIWHFPQEDNGRGEAAARLAHDARFRAALSPLADLVPDAQLLLLAESEAGILSLARSERLGRLSIEQVVASMGSEPFPGSTVSLAAEGNTDAGVSVAAITLAQREPALLCRQFFLPSAQAAYLAAACTTPEQYEQQALLLNTMLESLVIR